MKFNFKDIYKNPILGFIIIIIITLSIIIFKITSIPKDLKNLRSIGAAITNINLNTNIEKNEINSKNYINSLEKKIDDMNNINSTLQGIKVNSEYEPILDNIKEGLSNNILLYTQLTSILNNLNSNDLPKATENALSIKANCEANYKSCIESNVPIYLMKENNNYLSDIFFYINQIMKLNRDVDIKTSQKNDFIITLDKINLEFNPLMEDLFNTLSIIKRDKRDISVLVSDIHNKIQNFHQIQNDFYIVSIPESGNEIFSTLEEVFKCYDSYINSLLKGIMEEISTNNDNNTYYSEAKTSYDKVEDTLNIFQNMFDEYKTK